MYGETVKFEKETINIYLLMNYLKYCAFYKAEDFICSTPSIVHSSVITILILCPFSLDHKSLMIFFLDF
jgi:hypothetical protein